MKKKKVLFFGTPSIAVPSLQALSRRDDIEIVGVGVLPDKKVGRKQILSPCPVKISAQDLNLPIFEIQDKQALNKVFEETPCDIALVIAFGMIFPESVLSMPRCGVVNVHFSLLPLYRGASPVQSAIQNGDPESGITFQKMVKALDKGNILFQEKYPITGKSTSELFHFFAEETAQHIGNQIHIICESNTQGRVQDDELATYCGKLEKQDGLVNPLEETAEEIYRKYLAYDLFPGIFLETKKGALKLKEVSLKPLDESEAMICDNDTFLWILKAQLEGKPVHKIQDILRGNQVLEKHFKRD